MLLGWVMGALDAPAHYFKWGWILISAANLIVILLMILIFVLALLIPFPKDHSSSPSAASNAPAKSGEDGEPS
jgi:hypothetical protein